jgi:hypothetical protein
MQVITGAREEFARTSENIYLIGIRSNRGIRTIAFAIYHTPFVALCVTAVVLSIAQTSQTYWLWPVAAFGATLGALFVVSLLRILKRFRAGGHSYLLLTSSGMWCMLGSMEVGVPWDHVLTVHAKPRLFGRGYSIEAYHGGGWSKVQKADLGRDGGLSGRQARRLIRLLRKELGAGDDSIDIGFRARHPVVRFFGRLCKRR